MEQVKNNEGYTGALRRLRSAALVKERQGRSLGRNVELFRRQKVYAPVVRTPAGVSMVLRLGRSH